ncbi:type I toxin-antitoxin system Fst family toxin [Staphylococcus aureus]
MLTLFSHWLNNREK